MFGGERGAVLAITVDGREACRAEPVAKFRKGVHAAGRWLLAHRAVTEDGPGGNAAAGQRIQSLPVDHQVAVVLDDVGRLEITDIAGVIHRVDQEPAAGLERFRGDRERSEERRLGKEWVSTCR